MALGQFFFSKKRIFFIPYVKYGYSNFLCFMIHSLLKNKNCLTEGIGVHCRIAHTGKQTKAPSGKGCVKAHNSAYRVNPDVTSALKIASGRKTSTGKSSIPNLLKFK
jgi:hypothetical protein